MATTAAELALLFGWPEYLVFIAMLAVSLGIGIFYGCFGNKQNSTSEFLMGGRQMGTFPVAMSLIASFMSAITLLGTPAEMYQYGTQYWLIGASYFFVMPVAAYIYLPVFFKLKLTSVYEYLELRFNRSVRLMGSGIFILQMCVYMAIVVYAPALALSQVTGFNVYLAVVVIFVVCIFYTALGGMKAVIWTDTFQVIVMFASMLVVVVKGSIDVGGFGVVWLRNNESGRLELFDFDPNPTTRHSVWTLIVGGYFTWVTIYGVNQAQVQRYLSVSSVRKAQRAVWINLFGLFILLSICCYAGLVIYAKYYDCDPLTTKLVTTPDQLFPLFVMDTLGNIPGLPGLFVAGIFSGALSTVSSGLNSLAAIILEDFVKVCKKTPMTDATATKVSKLIAVVCGFVCFGLVFLAAQLGGVLQAALSIFGIIGGPLLGIFSLGLFFPWANSKGAFVGTITSLTFMMWIGFGANIAIAQKQIINVKKSFSVDGCLYYNATMSSPMTSSPDVLPLYRLSYMWYSATGCWMVIVVGMIVSFFTGFQDVEQLDKRLICPVVDNILCCLPKGLKKPIARIYGEKDKRKTSKVTVHNVSMNNVENGLSNPAFEGEMQKNGTDGNTKL